MARTALLFLLPAALVATAWMRLEQSPDGSMPLFLVGLALAPALVRPWWARAAATVVAVLLAAAVIFDRSLLDARPFHEERDFFGPIADAFRDGVLGFWDVSLPFTPAAQEDMHAVVLTAIFGFALAIALALAARRPIVASTLLLLASVWPATLVAGDDLARGAVTLAVVLVLLAFGGRRPTRAYRPALAAGAVLVAVALAASTSEAVAKTAFVNWKTWDPYDVPAKPVGVDYVWNANYAGLTWPKEKTTVLRIEGPERSLYWRATTLDRFDADLWLEDLATIGTSDEPVSVVLRDPLFPARGRNSDRWVRASVEVEALRDEHLVGPSMPAVWAPREIGLVRHRTGGVAAVIGGLQRGDRYDVWAYAPQPKPRELARVRPATERYGLDSRYRDLVPGVPAPAFGSDDRAAAMERMFTRYGRSLEAYRAFYERAQEIVGSPDSQYAAVLALEAWYRSEGGFVYDETPPMTLGPPPLVSFALDHQRGYCQHFAGAMALMLRYLGVPARVAVGFTSGTVDDSGRRWTVSDRDAHAWVEVWFRGWGWLPFDPTPARGQLSNPYSNASTNFDTVGAREALASGGTDFTSGLVDKLTERRVGEGFRGPDLPGQGGTFVTVRERGASLLQLLLVVAAALAALVVVGKALLRRARYLRRDPRGTAAACRRELVDFLADQGIVVGASATPQELAALIERRWSIDAVPFAQALAAARYAPPRDAARAAHRARLELRRLRRLLRGAIGVPARVRGAVSLRSLAA